MKVKFATIFTAQGLRCSFLEVADQSSMCKHNANDEEASNALETSLQKDETPRLCISVLNSFRFGQNSYPISFTFTLVIALTLMDVYFYPQQLSVTPRFSIRSGFQY